MRLTHLRNLVATVDAGSIRGAARALHVAQPDLTRSIQELEEELGLKLLERSPRGVVPTRVGKVFLARARNVQNEIRGMREEATQLTGGIATVSFGAGPSSAALLPRAVAAFRLQYPKAEIRIVSGFALRLLHRADTPLTPAAAAMLTAIKAEARTLAF